MRTSIVCSQNSRKVNMDVQQEFEARKIRLYKVIRRNIIQDLLRPIEEIKFMLRMIVRHQQIYKDEGTTQSNLQFRNITLDR